MTLATIIAVGLWSLWILVLLIAILSHNPNKGSGPYYD